MDAAMILVLILIAGVVALLAWFETNSRRNDARKKAMSTLAQPDHLDSSKTKSQREVESHAQTRKAA
jgi:hypothetical protein